jgi:hypothetical protein
MEQESRTFRAALVGTTAALCLASTLITGACAVKEPYDFPVMRLTDPPAADAQPPQ